eukprot:TRINITY_DN1413_c0_g1_i1.p1 TRINITY_DN1413_c0_g1~~TRINITY_DN1413_c0_g1_i1.p1  ORF type:complete len:364 (-),score=105.01 TRINITY_DN1413_c0_g1_i1:104-1135(-)
MGNSKSNLKGNNIYNVTVQQIMSTNRSPLLVVHENDTVDVVLKKLNEHGYISAPVVNSSGSCKKGFFAMNDVVMHLSRISKLAIKSDSADTESQHIKDDRLEELIIRQHYFHKETVHDVISRHRGDKRSLAIEISKPLSDVLMIFAHGVQRMCVTKNKKIVGILSQYTILKWLAEDTTRLGDTENEPAENLGIPWKKLVHIPQEMKTIDAIELIHNKGALSAPIVDADGNLVAHFSMSDIKALALNDVDFQSLILPIIEFIKQNREAEKHKETTQDVAHVVCAPRNSPFKDIILSLTNAHVHQCYLVDDDNKPVSLISLTHVCQRIFKFSPTLERKGGRRLSN